jgi:hypothetical protein
MSDADYRADPRPSITQLAKLDRMTPAHARVEWARPATEAMDLGTAVHARVLQPERYEELVLVRDEPVNPRTGQPFGRETKAYQEWLAEHAGLEATVIAPRDAEIVETMAASARRTHAWPLLRLCDLIEQPLYATIGGVEVRGRPDAICTTPPGRLIIDLKTTRTHATRSEFERSIASYGYGFQAAGYSMLAEANGIDARHFVFLVIENKPPYAAAAFRLMEEVVTYYRPRVEAAARLYAECAERGEWPAHPTAIQEIGLPRWHEGSREL